ncbi:hypothetical protein ACPPVV_18840 [Rhodanobacter sp. Col0626]|uniref:hypothetical protein n=1 Tax=Rhodanobacter sp. Col0626 TaxID=3415679 RepID=UPI003CF29105
MEIDFSIGNIPAKLRRGWFWGGMKLVTPSESLWLQHPLQPSTHWSFRLTRSWQRTVAGHRVRVEKTRPLLGAGIRSQGYRVFVDGELVADVDGM